MLKLLSSRNLCWLLSLLIVFPLNGCTVLQPVEGGNDRLSTKIKAQSLINKGDRVEIRTIDNREYRFRVQDIDDDFVRGDAVSVRIDEIANLSVRRFSRQRTVALVGVIIGGFLVLREAAFRSAP